MNGAILVDKPAGMTSADVLRALSSRGLKLGHAGTLDPLATGLLVVLVGKATRLQSLFLEAEKVYEGTFLLGLKTDTDDIEGSVTEQRPEFDFTSVQERLSEVVQQFSGAISQVPPQYSAIQVDGQRSYKVARRGESLELKPRGVTVEFNELSAVSEKELYFNLKCSKGTYIRSLARDIGDYLGCGAVVQTLRRLYSAPFSVDDARPLEKLVEKSLAEALLAPSLLCSALPGLELSESEVKLLRSGNQQPLQRFRLIHQNEMLAAMLGSAGELCGLAERQESGNWRIRAIL